ncbi:MAG: hypothetical protein ACK4GM_05100 [Tabrizicola sp.]
MSDFEIKVVGARPERREGRVRRGLRLTFRAIRAVLMRPRLLASSGLAVFLLTVGTPHVGFEYECGHPMSGPGTCRNVLWCAYYGVQGRRVEFPRDGESCRIVTFLPLDVNKLIGG